MVKRWQVSVDAISDADMTRFEVLIYRTLRFQSLRYRVGDYSCFQRAGGRHTVSSAKA